MHDAFERRVMAAAVALWWVVLLATGLLLVSWIAYLLIVPAQPAWLVSLWGPDLSWTEVQNVWLWAIVAFKLIVFLMAMAALWLTLWARQLRKAAARP
jgi:uncharacterized membrane protein YadS